MASGFVPRAPRFHRTYNFAIAAFLVLMALPLLAIITLLVVATQGRPIFYRGPRIGLGERTFGIVKFRTLNSERAFQVTRHQVLPVGSGLETPLGAFLRETRLDELPQLFNVLLGDMNICGPRPVRAEIAALNADRIPYYRQRFEVRPGLLGPTQACMSHGTPKTVRARFNSRLCRRPVSYRGEIAIITLVGACVVARTLDRVWNRIAVSVRGRRAPAARATAAEFVAANGAVHRVLEIGRSEILIDGACAPGPGRLVQRLPDGQRRSAALCVVSEGAVAFEGTSRIRYHPSGDFAQHVLERYIFRKVVVPHRSHFLLRKLGRALRRRATGAARIGRRAMSLRAPRRAGRGWPRRAMPGISPWAGEPRHEEVALQSPRRDGGPESDRPKGADRSIRPRAGLTAQR